MKFFQHLIRGRRNILLLLTWMLIFSVGSTVCRASGYLLFAANPFARGRAADISIKYLDAQRGTVEKIASHPGYKTGMRDSEVDYYARIAVVHDDSMHDLLLHYGTYILLAVHNHHIQVRKIIFPDGLNNLWFGSTSKHLQKFRAITVSGEHHLKVHLSTYNLRTGKIAKLPWAKANAIYYGGRGFYHLAGDRTPASMMEPIPLAGGRRFDRISYFSGEWWLQGRMPALRLPHPPPASMIPPHAASQAKVYGNILGNVALDIKYGLSKSTYKHRLLVYRQAVGKWSSLNIPYHHIVVQVFPDCFVIYRRPKKIIFPQTLQDTVITQALLYGYNSAIIFFDDTGKSANFTQRNKFEILWADEHNILSYRLYRQIYLYQMRDGVVGKKPRITFSGPHDSFNCPFAVFPVSRKPKLDLKPTAATSPAKTRAKDH